MAFETAIAASTSQGATNTAKSSMPTQSQHRNSKTQDCYLSDATEPQDAHKTKSKGSTPPQSQHRSSQSHCSSYLSDNTELRDAYGTKSKMAAARWSNSERGIAKARQQALNEARQERFALLGVYDEVASEGEEFEELEASEDFEFELGWEEPSEDTDEYVESGFYDDMEE